MLPNDLRLGTAAVTLTPGSSATVTFTVPVPFLPSADSTVMSTVVSPAAFDQTEKLA
ncbi:MAG: hypothetical protein HUJ62_00475 [Streptococcus gallolyticus]|nr:hypothetical protein [Streptococcus gallolyticus]